MFSQKITIWFNKISILFVEMCYSGIKSRRVPNSAMTASSSWSTDYQAFYGRLDNTGNQRGFWHIARGIYQILHTVAI